jgi:DNA end-binding protein Ku
MERLMAPRAYWKGYLRVSLVSCPIQLFPATSDREKVRFHLINKKTGHRIKYRKVDAETGKQVDPEDIVMGYKAGRGQYVAVTENDLKTIEIEGTHTIEIDKFVPRNEIDDLYLSRPYYITPAGEIGRQAYVIIREAIRKERYGSARQGGAHDARTCHSD